ncbi:MAG: glycosyltransferase [bacterium]|nr:glycosyltransferase [bacterium]
MEIDMRMSIVVLTYNRCESLRELLAELQPVSSATGCELIVVDNCSCDETEEMLRQMQPEVHIVRTSANVGVSARNEGIRRASGEIIIALDDDVYGLTYEGINHIHQRFAESAELGALNFQVRDPSGRLCNWVHHRSSTDASGRFQTYEITEGAVAFRREAALSAGLYWEKYFISHEGPDLAFRILNAGFSVEYDGVVSVVHKHEAQSRPSWRFYYYDTRNQLWLAARNMPFGYSVRYLMRGLSGMLFYSLRDGFVLWWARGVWDGIRDERSMWRQKTLDAPNCLINSCHRQKSSRIVIIDSHADRPVGK